MIETPLRVTREAARGFVDSATLGATEFGFKALEDRMGLEELATWGDLVQQGRYAELGARGLGHLAGFVVGAPGRIIGAVARSAAVKGAAGTAAGAVRLPGLAPGLTESIAFMTEAGAAGAVELVGKAVFDKLTPEDFEEVGLDIFVAAAIPHVFRGGGSLAKGAGRRITGGLGRAIRQRPQAFDRALENLQETAVSIGRRAGRAVGQGVRRFVQDESGSISIGPFGTGARDAAKGAGEAAAAGVFGVSKKLIRPKQRRILAALSNRVGLRFPEDIRPMTPAGSIRALQESQAEALIRRLRAMAQQRNIARKITVGGGERVEGITSFLPGQPLGVPGGMRVSKNVIDDWFINNRKFAQTSEVINRMAPVHGPIFNTSAEEVFSRASRGAGPWHDVEIAAWEQVPRRDWPKVARILNGQTLTPPVSDTSIVARAARELRQSNQRQLPIIQAIGLRLKDGKPFVPIKDWFPQEYSINTQEAVLRFLQPAAGSRITKKIAQPGIHLNIKKVDGAKWLKAGTIPPELSRTARGRFIWKRTNEVLDDMVTTMR